jgi:predicted acetyltransferase
MLPDIRPVRDGELDEFVAVLEVAAGRHADAEALAEGRATYRLDRTLAAFDGDRIVGGTASDAVELTVPGGAAVQAAKITLTGLLPGYRRQGLASAFMRRQLHDLRDRREPLAVLTTSQSGVPGRHGFSPATRAMAVEITPGQRAIDGAPATNLRPRLLDRAEAERILPAMYDRHRRSQTGQVSRSPDFWRGWFLDRPLLRIGSSDRFVVVAEDTAGNCEGYLTYRLTYGPLREEPVRELVVEDLVPVTDEARRALWAYCLDFGQAARVSAWNLPADEPLPWTIGGVRAVRVTGLRDFLRLRLVDVPAALAARSYPVAGTLVMEVTDEVLTANAGRYLLDGGPDGASCAATADPAELSLSMSELSAVYLGGADLTTLARAGRVVEHAAGAVRRADAMFAWRPGPWTVTDW